jgi:hypothetical protein
MPNEVYYILLAAKSGEAHKQGDGEIKLYPSRDAANTDAIALRETNPDQHYLIEGPHTKDRLDWQARERARLDDGTHTPLIPELAQHCKPGHFAHVAKGDPRSLAYTKNEADGIRDIQKRMNVSAYLEAYAPTLDSYQRAELQRLHQNMAAETELLIATDGDDIQEVYQHHNDEGGVGTSCMRHDLDEFQGSEHPVQAYGDSDLAVAYTKDDRGRTTARAIIWPAKRCYSRMYGGDRYLPELKRLMMAAGYKPSSGYYGHCSGASEHSLAGARLRAIPDRNDRGRFIVPYVDEGSIGILSDDRQWITIARGEDAPVGAKVLSLKSTDGVARLIGPRCPSCRSDRTGDALFTPAYRSYPADEARVSQHCSNCLNSYTFVCMGTGQRYNNNEVARSDTPGGTYARAWAVANLPVCSCCGGFNRPEQLLHYRSSLDAKLTKVCPSCASDYAFWCEETEALTSNDLRVRALDVGARKRIAFGDVNKLIDRSTSILAPSMATDPHWIELHTIALAEVEHGLVTLCQINIHTGAPVTNLTGRSVERYLGVVSALRAVRVGHKPVRWTQEIEDLIPHVGDWVKVSDALNFPEADGCIGLVLDTCTHPTHSFMVRLTDGREAFCPCSSLTKVPTPDGASIMPKTDPHIGETVMFNHFSSPRFGQRGVVEKIENDGPLSGGPTLTVRFPDGSTRRAAPVRLQRIGPEVEPDPTLPMDLPVPAQPSNVAYRPPHVWQLGDRVRLLPNCVEVSIPAREIGQEGVVIRISFERLVVRMETGHASTGNEWNVRPGMCELVEAAVEAAE